MVVKVTVKPVRAAGAEAAAPAAADEGCGLLLTRLARAANRSLACSLGELGLRAQQFGVLHLIGAAGPLSQADLAAMLRVHASNLVRVLDEMEEAELIVRERDPDDRRRQRVAITPAGVRMRRRAERTAAAAEAELLAPLSRAEQVALRGLLGRVATHACGLPTAVGCSE
jgi:DNA-binding MarR family transcriptional regulator